jgi:photosystem II stability/assembly factor-like uncharacterized protein
MNLPRHGGYPLFVLIALLALPSNLSAAASSAHALLLDGAIAGSSVVAVGERGTIARSTDSGRTWSPAKSPTLAALTAVSFADAQHGWAVGHDALILTSNDGGLSWTKQWQGENLADSFLDVIALDAAHVIAVGAYGLVEVSTDGGKSWMRQKVVAEDYHLNRISRGPTGTLFIAGEHGTLLRSTDGGAHWSALRVDYEGSFYGIVPIDGRTLLAHGLRGRVFRSEDGGISWTEISTKRTELMACGAVLGAGRIVLGGNARAILVSGDAGRSFESRDVGLTGNVTELVVLPDGALVAFGEFGAVRIEAEAVEH